MRGAVQPGQAIPMPKTIAAENLQLLLMFDCLTPLLTSRRAQAREPKTRSDFGGRRAATC
jgi:hypothetical protein